jgi:thiol-disulfide isomerase/thioredoxin
MMRPMSETDSKPKSLRTVSASTPRRGILLGAGALATGVGLGLAWWSSPSQSRVSTPAVEPIPGFWALQWSTPQGTPLLLQSFRGKPLLINFWATWCPPCIEELPLINAFYNQNHVNGWQVIGLAIDKPAAVKAFLQKTPLDFPVAVEPLGGSNLARELGNPSGSLPYSVAINGQGGIVQRKLGRLKQEDLDRWAQLK